MATDPDPLVDVPEVRGLAAGPMAEWDDDEWPEWEALDDVLEALGLERVVDPEPEDDPRDEAQRAASLPRLAALPA